MREGKEIRMKSKMRFFRREFSMCCVLTQRPCDVRVSKKSDVFDAPFLSFVPFLVPCNVIMRKDKDVTPSIEENVLCKGGSDV